MTFYKKGAEAELIETTFDGKKALLKKIIKGKKVGKSPMGASPLPTSGGLGNVPLAPSGDAITGGGGSNLGTNGIF